jgi:hypothetical protein
MTFPSPSHLYDGLLTASHLRQFCHLTEARKKFLAPPAEIRQAFHRVETFRKKCGKLSTGWKPSGKSAARFPPGGNLPEKVRQAFHRVETFRKKCGKLSTEWKPSGKCAASFPPSGNLPEKVRQAFHRVEKPANGPIWVYMRQLQSSPFSIED